MMTRPLLLLIMSHLFGAASLAGQQLEITNPVRLLALGDSYTIGQSVEPQDRWPVQLGDTLTTLGFTIDEIEIVATTGWTTGNLLNALDQNPPEEDYSMVSLLIGVNNQYQGGSLGAYETQFEELLNRAIQYAGGNPSHVLVISIPDYHYTPFGAGSPHISEEIDEFNAVNQQVTGDYGVPYVYITDISRRGLDEPALVATDGLHPSGLMYALWVRRIVEGADLQVISSNQDVRRDDLNVDLHTNPVRDELYLNLTGPGSCMISTMNGVVIRQVEVAQEATLDVSDIPQGMYLLGVAGSHGTIYRRFVKL